MTASHLSLTDDGPAATEHAETMLQHLKAQVRLHTTALERRATALRAAVSDLMYLGQLIGPDLDRFRGYLPYTPDMRVLEVFGEMQAFRRIMAACDISEPAYRHAKERFGDVAVDALVADEAAAGR